MSIKSLFTKQHYLSTYLKLIPHVAIFMQVHDISKSPPHLAGFSETVLKRSCRTMQQSHALIRVYT
ncbi:hypothetical protein B7J67_22295 [Salmonella enterica]|nr:hypothetical protein [Salmonella enterica]EDR0453522.1 hypothetical protein [Salmonella enterica subsp. enterica serovar 4,[5],12:i:-]EAY1374889.1 hypothetical protein [Salmonella enterica]EAZ7978331.1 hypothetical protein [Salmonella enterica]EBA9471724.1 hypothetical protein [Salmonella enterica]